MAVQLAEPDAIAPGPEPVCVCVCVVLGTFFLKSMEKQKRKFFENWKILNFKAEYEWLFFQF